MSEASPSVAALGGWLRERRDAGDDGKTLLLGFIASDACFAVAAGLRGERDHPGFERFARYLLHRRFACDGHVLMLPALHGDAPVYLVHGCVAAQALAFMVDAHGHRCRWPGAALPLRVDDHDRQPTPALLRRDMDARFAALAVPPPSSL
ncbi:MAG: hypothetical protein KDJ24_11070 [Gammaproteobacteria bacterium]|nr:hypothetical protein [Gammaproteobacteria bacterium]